MGRAVTEPLVNDPAGPMPADAPLPTSLAGEALPVEEDESTVGTGSVVAIGCVVAMLLVLVLGILLVLWTR